MLSGPKQTIQDAEPCDDVSVNVLSHCTIYSSGCAFPLLLPFSIQFFGSQSQLLACFLKEFQFQHEVF